jgi:hypothetical protein
MRTILLIAPIIAASMPCPRAALARGECVYPRVRTLPNGNLAFARPIFIYDAPNGKPISRLRLFMAFVVASERNGFLQIMGSTNSDPDYRDGQIVGWVRKADFAEEPLRNCDFPH